jgi:hypothetical protein
MSTERRLRAVSGAGSLLLALLGAGFVAAAPPPEPPTTAQAAHQVAHPEGLRSRLLRDEPSPVRGLDAAIFTELSPVTVSDPAVRLPEDQQLDDTRAAP